MHSLVGAAAIWFLALPSDGGSCTDLLELPRGRCDPASSSDEGSQEDSAGCSLCLPEITIVTVGQQEISSGGDAHSVETHSRVLTQELERWMTQAHEFLSSGAPFLPEFRDLWEQLSEADLSPDSGLDRLTARCPEAMVLARLLWAVLWALAARWVGFGTAWAQAPAELAEVQLSMPPELHAAHGPRLLAAGRAAGAVLELPEGEWQRRLEALTAGHNRTAWSVPFHVPLGRSLRHAHLRSFARREPPPQALRDRALLEMHAALLPLVLEAWPGGSSLAALAAPGGMTGDDLGDSLHFYVGVESHDAWIQLTFEITEALGQLGWRGCYLEELADRIVAGWQPGRLECTLSTGGGSASARLQRYFVLPDGRRVAALDPQPGSDAGAAPFGRWGRSLPSELLLPWAICSAWGQRVLCPARSLELLQGWGQPFWEVDGLSSSSAAAAATASGSDSRSALPRWLTRKAAAVQGNSLCFSERRTRAGLTFAACCGTATPLAGCWDEVLQPTSCCRPHRHRCAELLAFSFDTRAVRMQLPEAAAVEAIDSASRRGRTLHCRSDDLFREYFDEIRLTLLRGGRPQNGITGSASEAFAMSAGNLTWEVCPDVAWLARLGMLQKAYESFLRQPLVVDAVRTQQSVQQQIEADAEAIEAATNSGELTLLPSRVWRLLREGACGKVLEAEVQGESDEGASQPDYRWPSPRLAGRPLSEHGLPCALETRGLVVGNDFDGWEKAEASGSNFVDLSNPMPEDGRLVDFRFSARSLAAGAMVEIIVLRLEHAGVDGPVFRPQSFVARHRLGTGEGGQDGAQAAELLVWRGDYLCFVVHHAELHFQSGCIDCLVAEFNTGNIDLGSQLSRSYAWRATLLPMRCTPETWWQPSPASAPAASPALPLRGGPPPASSRASCGPGASAFERVCSYGDVCYDLSEGAMLFFGEPPRQDLSVGLSALRDGRSAWKPVARAAPAAGGSAVWVDLPTYLAVRHAPQNWAHHAVEAVLAVYALALAAEDGAGSPHGKRLLFFLDDCSLALRGDSVEYCVQHVPQPLACLREMSALCAKFSRQLWPLLSDWPALEASHLRERLAGAGGSGEPRYLCFRSLHAGTGAWHRPLTAEGEWAADPSFAPAMRLFRWHAAARLGVSADSGQAPEDGRGRALSAVVKRNRRSVRNPDELLLWLREVAEAKSLRFAEVSFQGSLAEQAALLASTSLLVASGGSSHFAGLFLPAGAALLVLPACAAVSPEPGKVDCFSARLLACCGMRWAEYPVRWEDIVYSVGRGFDYTVRREVLEEVLHQLLE